MTAVLFAGFGLIALFCCMNYALGQIDRALDDAFNGDRHE